MSEDIITITHTKNPLFKEGMIVKWKNKHYKILKIQSSNIHNEMEQTITLEEIKIKE